MRKGDVLMWSREGNVHIICFEATTGKIKKKI